MVRRDDRGRKIFLKTALRPAQARAVADRRLNDARYLAASLSNDRANGAMYLAGFVVECLLKARLLEKHPWLQRARSATGLDDERRALWSLCYRSHELDELLARMPEVEATLLAEGPRSQRLLVVLRTLCAEWTIFARYAPSSASIEDAREFVRRVETVRKCLLA